MILYNLFPIPVLRMPANPETYDSIQIEIKNAWEKMKSDKDYSNLTSYNFLSKKNPAEKTYDFIEKFNCVNLKKRIEECALEYVYQSGWTGQWNGNSPIEIKESWLNVMESGSNHSPHCHPGYSISGVYYFRVDESFGSLSFSNPNPLLMSCNFPQGFICPQHSLITPCRGDIILFPSWLIHSTLINQNDEDRVSVAFNIDLVNLNNTRIKNGLVKGSHIPVVKSEI